MKPAVQTGKASLAFQEPVYIQSAASIVGKKEGEGPLRDCFDMVSEDPRFGTDTWENAESTLQKETAVLAIGKAGLKPSDIRMAFAGDLLAQTIASSFGIADMGIPFYGLYGACSTIGESLSLGAMSVWKPAPTLCNLDSDGKRSLCPWKQSASSGKHRKCLSPPARKRLCGSHCAYYRNGCRFWFS